MTTRSATAFARAALARTAHADAWEQHGLLRATVGGEAAELPGVRVMTSGLPYAQWNNGDVTDPAAADVDALRAWYAARRVPWGVRVPAGAPWPHGRLLFHKRLMLLEAADLVPAVPVPGLTVRAARLADLDAVAHVDAVAFDADAATEAAWVRPMLEAERATVALAELDGRPVATASVLRTDGRAGAAAYLAGVAVLPEARRRGVAAAVSAWLLARAVAAGARIAHLHPDTDAAARVYARLGFVEVDGLDVYVDLA
ncbi:GNAT family N-acetyltransferase [Cellulomonas telluris]|uniref:GNAT family N-acetyltransferase n=1 Tax=Cellulomonas telluris TaxID=2306636 RepID=UPI0010A9324B|nr:GNAT family N-acetyltransferase [Cellulomonas telluris]